MRLTVLPATPFSLLSLSPLSLSVLHLYVQFLLPWHAQSAHNNEACNFKPVSRCLPPLPLPFSPWCILPLCSGCFSLHFVIHVINAIYANIPNGAALECHLFMWLQGKVKGKRGEEKRR